MNGKGKGSLATKRVAETISPHSKPISALLRVALSSHSLTAQIIELEMAAEPCAFPTW